MKTGNPLIEAFIDSVTEHSFKNHAKDFRNERSSGKLLSPGRSRGEPLQVHEKDNFRNHIRETLQDPNTCYFIDETDDRMVFFNADPRSRAMIVFNPAQKDDHAGTMFRSPIKEGELGFEDQIRNTKANMGKRPDVQSVTDLKWVAHLEKYDSQILNAPKTTLEQGDVPEHFHKSHDYKMSFPYTPVPLDVPLYSVDLGVRLDLAERRDVDREYH